MAHLPGIENIYTFLKQSEVDILQMDFRELIYFLHEFNMFPYIRLHSLHQRIKSSIFNFFVSWKGVFAHQSRDTLRQCGVLVISTPQCRARRGCHRPCGGSPAPCTLCGLRRQSMGKWGFLSPAPASAARCPPQL